MDCLLTVRGAFGGGFGRRLCRSHARKTGGTKG